MTTTTHTILAELPRHLSDAEGATDTEYFKADITYSYTPTTGRRWSADLTVLAVHPHVDVGDFLSRQELRDLAQEWIDDRGYDAACALAQRQNGEEAA